MATIYFCALPSATTPTWNRANIGTNSGFSDSPPMHGTQGSAPAAPQTNYEPTISWTGSLTPGQEYKLWAIWDDGSASSNSGVPQASAAFRTSAVLVIADATHGHVADSLTLTTTGSTDLVVADANHGHTADALALTLDTTLVVADATHGHAADSLPLTTDSSLVVNDATHGHAAGNLSLSADGATDLQISSSVHSHSAQNLALSLPSEIVPVTQYRQLFVDHDHNRQRHTEDEELLACVISHLVATRELRV